MSFDYSVHVVPGHRNAYRHGEDKRGVLHRDISIGNILVVVGSSDKAPKDALIDFDNAVFWKNHESVPGDPLTVSNAAIQ